MKNNMTIERTLDAPRSQVWAVLADYGNIVDWNSGIKASRVRMTPGQVGPVGLQPIVSDVADGLRLPAISKTPDDDGHFAVVKSWTSGSLSLGLGLRVDIDVVSMC